MRRTAVVVTVLTIVGASLGACSGGASTRATTTSSGVAADARAPRASGFPTGSTAHSPEALAEAAYVFGVPLVVTRRTMHLLEAGRGPNNLLRQGAPSSEASRIVVSPNHDTLYAVAALDVSAGPLIVTVPHAGTRYYTLQILDAYTDSVGYIGTRTDHDRPGTYAVVGPDWSGRFAPGVGVIHVPTPEGVLLGRVAFRDDADVPAAHALLGGIALRPATATDEDVGAGSGAPATSGGTASGASETPGRTSAALSPLPTGTPQGAVTEGIAFYDELGDALAADPPTTTRQRDLVAKLRAIGVGPGLHPTRDVTDPAVRGALQTGLDRGRVRIAAAESSFGASAGGWRVARNLGTYADDLVLRAVVAVVAWGANIPAEALYPSTTVDAGGKPLDGSHTYVVHFPPRGLPPVEAFWSLTLYGPDHFFVANPLDRWSISDRTPGIRRGPDGSLDLWIGHAAPAGHESNWLPAPDGPFSLIMRLYLPGPAARAGTYRYPGVQECDASLPCTR